MSNFQNGMALLLLGMGFVLAFLYLMTICMKLMSKVVGWLNKIYPEVVEEVATTAKKAVANADEAIAVAIAAIMAKKG